MNCLITLRGVPGYFSSSAVCCVVAKEASSMAKKRANGEGNIRKRKDGRWEGRYSPIVNGKRMARNVYAKTEAECEEKLAILIREMKAEIAARKNQEKQKSAAG